MFVIWYYHTTCDNFKGHLLHYSDILLFNKYDVKAIIGDCDYLIYDKYVIRLSNKGLNYVGMSEVLGIPYNLLVQKINFINLNS